MKKYLKQLKANKKGFTLVEMIVVIGIIGILAAILVPSMSGYLRNAKETKKEANARTVYTAAQAAVTSLESTSSVEDGTYGLADDKSATVNGTLNGKIEELIGASNYTKLITLQVTVANGAVTQVVVNDGSGATTYPKAVSESPASSESPS